MEACNRHAFATGFFPVEACFQGLAMFQHVSALLYCQLIFHCMDVPHFTHSLVGEHLACIHIFVLMSNAAMNTYASFPLGICIRGGIVK